MRGSLRDVSQAGFHWLRIQAMDSRPRLRGEGFAGMTIGTGE
jgi:hypothetical protein